jgi:hypothetical protein
MRSDPCRRRPLAAGSGVLPSSLRRRFKLTVRDLAVLMMALSDNAATNVSHRRGRLRLRSTRAWTPSACSEHSAAPPHDRPRGRPSRRGERLDARARCSCLIEAIRKGDGLSSRLRRGRPARRGRRAQEHRRSATHSPGASPFSTSRGELEGVRTATGLVDLKHRPYALAIMTTALARMSPDGENAIREISRLVYETFDRLDRASPEGRLLGR